MSERLERYKKAKRDRIDGKFNGAPFFYSFPRLGKIVPAIPKGMQLMLLAGNGIGKSQAMLGLFLMTVYNLIKNHNYKAKFHIFLLEDPKELFEDRLFCRILYTMYNIEIDPMKLNSVKQDIVSDEIESKFEEVDKKVEDILSYCIVTDNIFNATGIYKTLRTRSEELGTHVWKNKEFVYKNDDGTIYKKNIKVHDKYVPNDSDLHNIVFVDNLNSLSEEYNNLLHKTLTIRDAINKWSFDYGRLQICKKWNWSIVNIMQTDLATDKKQFDYKGNNIVEKVEPTLGSLGESKTCSRAHHLVLALFSPSRFGIKTYEGYNIGLLKDNFRALIILKSNFSISNVKVPLYFNGSCSYYKELPLKMTPEDYEKYKFKIKKE